MWRGILAVIAALLANVGWIGVCRAVDGVEMDTASEHRTLTAAEREALRHPLFFGERSAPNTVLLFNNVQCPACVAFWPEMLELMDALDPANTKVIVQGTAFDEAGAVVTVCAFLLAEQNPRLARAYLSAVHAAGEDAYQDPAAWALGWAGSQTDQPFDQGRFLALWNDEGMEAIDQGAEELVAAYAITGTPSVVVNGRVYGQRPDAAGLLRAVHESRPRPSVP